MTFIISLLIFISLLFIWIGFIPVSKMILKTKKEKTRNVGYTSWMFDLLGVFGLFMIINLFFSVNVALISLPFGALLGRKVPLAIKKWKKYFLRKRVLEELEGATMVISSTVRGGYTLLDAFNQAQKYVRSPLKEEFEAIVNQVQYGGSSLKDALKLFTDRWKSSEIDMLYHATYLATEFGGKEVPKILRSVSNTIRERKQVEEKIKAKTTYQRISALTISLLPVVILLVFKTLSPDIYETLLGESRIFLLIGISLTIVGWYMVFNIMNKIEDF